MKYKELYETIFKSADDKEIKKRQSEKWQIWIEDEIADSKLIQNSDGSYDYKGDVNFGSENLKEIPIKFRNVSGDFYCSDNKLQSLKGYPKKVGEDFYCSRQKITINSLLKMSRKFVM